MTLIGRGEVRLDSRGAVKRCDVNAALLLGAEGPDQVVGRPLGEWLDDEGRGWVDPISVVGTAGLDERTVCTSAGRALRILGDIDGKTIWIDDAHRTSALRFERERALRDRAILDLVPMLRRELNDPMSIVLGRLELLLELGGSGDPKIDRHLDVALAHARRISNTLHLLRMVGWSAPACSPSVDLDVAVRLALDEVGSCVRVHRLVVPSVQVASDEQVLVQGLVSLVNRLLDRAGPGERLAVVGDDGGGRVTLELSIDAGLDRHDLDWSSVDIGHELGVAGAAFERAGVSVELSRQPGALCYRLSLARAVKVPEVTTTPRPEIWLVGIDDPSELLARALHRGGARVQAIPDAERAMRRLRDGAPHGLLTSLCLPGRSGLAVLDVVERLHPDLLGRCGLVCRQPVSGLHRGVKELRAPLDPDSVLRTLGCGPPVLMQSGTTLP